MMQHLLTPEWKNKNVQTGELIMKLVKSIKIVFEDCDSVCFDKLDLGIFNMEDIKCEILHKYRQDRF